MDSGLHLTKDERQNEINRYTSKLLPQGAWKYGSSNQDEENTPTLSSEKMIELKSMSFDKARKLNRPSQSSYQEHYNFDGNNTSYTSIYSRILNNQERVPDQIRAQVIYPHQHMPTANNDLDSKYEYDDMFAKAEAESQRKDISIHISHGGDPNDSSTKPRKLKSRIQGRSFEQSILQNNLSGNHNDEDQEMNDEGSFKLQNFLEKKDWEDNIKLKSTYGQNYMKNQKEQAQERKNNKLSSQIKKDDDQDQLLNIQKQMEERRQKKKREFDVQNSNEQNLIVQYTNSLFTEEGREKQKEESQRLKEQDLSQIISDIQNIQNSNKLDIITTNADSDLERCKQTLQSIPETVHPSILGTNLSDVRSNIFKDQRGITGSSLGFGQSSSSYHDNISPSDRFQQFSQNIYNINGMNSIYPKKKNRNTIADLTQMSIPGLEQPQENAVSSKEIKYFYESFSKYISLKKFSDQELQFQLSENKQKQGDQALESVYSPSYLKQQKKLQELQIQSWFEKLLNHEKSITMTIIDQEIVTLIKCMHNLYSEYGHGIYQVEYPTYKGQQKVDYDRYEKVLNYNLLFRKPKYGVDNSYNYNYDYHGKIVPDNIMTKELKDYQDKLISNIRLVKIGDHEALTLSNDLLENTQFLLRTFQSINSEFLNSELKIDKVEVQTAMASTVLGYQSKVNNEEQKGQQRKKNNQESYFTLNERECKQKSDDFRERRSMYQRQGTKPHPQQQITFKEVYSNRSQMTLGQVLCHLFEKAINIQYQEFQNKLQPQMKDFFFTTQNAEIYQNDAKYAKYWKDLGTKGQEVFWNDIEQKQDNFVEEIKGNELIKKIKQFEDIQEETEETDNYSTSNERPHETLDQKYKDKKTIFNHDSDGSEDWSNLVQQKLDKNHMKLTKLNAKKLQKDYLGDSDSFDLENQKRPQMNQYDKSFGVMGKNDYLVKPQGKGYKALDSDSENDRTITDNSEISNYRDSMSGQDQMRAIYSTKDDQQEQKNYSDNTSYEGDKFESEEDQDDDFSLPKDHQQNHNKVQSQNFKNLKKGFEIRQYQSTGSQVSNLKVEENKEKMKQPWFKKNQKQTQQNIESQKENQIRRYVKNYIQKLKKNSQCKKGNELSEFDSAYLFIREISSFVKLENTKITNLNLFELVKNKFNQEVYRVLKEQMEIKIKNDLDDLENLESPAPSKKNKKKSKKTTKKAEDEKEEVEPMVEKEEAVQVAEEEKKNKKSKVRQRKNRKKQKGNKVTGTEEIDIGGEPPEEEEKSPLANETKHIVDAIRDTLTNPSSDLFEDMKDDELDAQRMLQILKQKDAEIRRFENQCIKDIKEKVFPDSDFSSTEQEQLSQEHQKYKDERTSLISGQFTHKYPNDFESFKFDELDQQEEWGDEYSLRKRSQLEISQSKEDLLKNRDFVLQQREKNHLSTFNNISELDDLVQQTKRLGEDVSKKQEENKKKIVFTDLKEQREKEAKNKMQADYSEKAIDQGEEETEGQKKKKKKKNKKKKKSQAVDSVAAAEETKKIEEDTQQWQKDVNNLLKKEKNSDEGQSDGDDNKYFDDNYFENETGLKLEDINPEFSEEKEIEHLVDQVKIDEDKYPKPDLQLCKDYVINKEEQKTESIIINSQQSIDPVIKFGEEFKEPEESIEIQETPEPEKVLNKKKQAKQDKKKEAKQKTKNKAKELKQKQEELKAQKAQQRKEIQQQKQAQKKDEPNEEEEADTQIIESLAQKDEKQYILPGLDILNKQTKEGEQTAVAKVRQSKRVQFERDQSYDASKVPKRGSSRGTSMASSNENKKDEVLLNDLDVLFPKEYVKPLQSTHQSIIDSLNNSKKNSPESSNTKNTKEEFTLDAQGLNEKLEELIQEEERPIKRGRSQSNQKSMLVPETKKKAKAKKSEKSTDESISIQNKKNFDDIQPFEIIRPEPKLTKTQKKTEKKKQNREKQLAAQKEKEEKKVEQPKPKQDKKKAEVEKEDTINYVQAFEASQQAQKNPQQVVKVEESSKPKNSSAQKKKADKLIIDSSDDPQETLAKILNDPSTSPPDLLDPAITSAAPINVFNQQEPQNNQMFNNDLMNQMSQNMLQPMMGQALNMMNMETNQNNNFQQKQNSQVQVDIIRFTIQQNQMPINQQRNNQMFPQNNVPPSANWSNNTPVQQSPQPQPQPQSSPSPQPQQPQQQQQNFNQNMNFMPNFQNMQMQNFQNMQNMQVPQMGFNNFSQNPQNFQNFQNMPMINQNQGFNPMMNMNMNQNQQYMMQNQMINPFMMNNSGFQNNQGQFGNQFNQSMIQQQNQQKMQQQAQANYLMYQHYFNQQQMNQANNMQMYQQQQQMIMQQKYQKQFEQQMAAQNEIMPDPNVIEISDQIDYKMPSNRFSQMIPQPGRNQSMAGFNAQQTQQQMIMQMNNLKNQGYVLNMMDYQQLIQMNPQELQYVGEFYEVLDAQIHKIQADQESKLYKTQKLRDIAFQLIKDKIQEIYQNKSKNLPYSRNIKVEVYGSMATGLAIDSSDLDILISDFIDQNSPRFNGLTRQELIEEMQIIHQSLNTVFALKTNTLIESASVPVIKLQINFIKLCERELKKDTAENLGIELHEIIDDDELRTLNIDITLNEPNKNIEEIGPGKPISGEHLGLQCTKYIKQKLKEYPKMKTLALIFKKFLSLKNLNKPFSGGLSSYSLVQMIHSILKYQESQGFIKNTGIFFKSFVDYFGHNFQPFEMAIGSNGEFTSRDEVSYILHNITCNINQQLMEPESNYMLDKSICTCGLTKNRPPGGAPNESNQIATLLNKLIYNQGQMEDDLDIDFKGPRRQQTSVGTFNQPLLMIVDPLNKFNNLGKSSYNFTVIQQEFKEVYSRLNDELKKFVKYAASRDQLGHDKSQDLHLDGLIPRILDIEYQFQPPPKTEEIKEKEELKKQTSTNSTKSNQKQKNSKKSKSKQNQ